MIDGDLKIREFIYDKAQIVDGGNGLWDAKNLRTTRGLKK
jgi:hypothetical protein